MVKDNVFLIAEVAQAHDGSLGILHSYIDALAETGVDAIKFQTHIAESESSPLEPFRTKFSYEDDTRYDYWQRMEFNVDQWRQIKQHCEEVGLEFISSPFSNRAVDLLEEIGVNRYKIGSGEVSNFLMLEKIAQTGKEIILSSGMSSFSELDQTISFLQSFGSKLRLLQCTTEYPTKPENIGLNVISELKDKYGLPTGLSDHSGSIYPSIAATALGADLLEFHVVFDKRMFGPDASSSLEIDDVTQLVRAVRMVETMLDHQVDKNSTAKFSSLKQIFEKSLAVNKQMSKGSVLRFEDLEAKKPAGVGIPAKQYADVIGKELKRDLAQWDFISVDDLNA